MVTVRHTAPLLPACCCSRMPRWRPEATACATAVTAAALLCCHPRMTTYVCKCGNGRAMIGSPQSRLDHDDAKSIALAVGWQPPPCTQSPVPLLTHSKQPSNLPHSHSSPLAPHYNPQQPNAVCRCAGSGGGNSSSGSCCTRQAAGHAEPTKPTAHHTAIWFDRGGDP